MQTFDITVISTVKAKPIVEDVLAKAECVGLINRWVLEGLTMRYRCELDIDHEGVLPINIQMFELALDFAKRGLSVDANSKISEIKILDD